MAFLRGTTADPEGNITMEREALTMEALAMATAVPNACGRDAVYCRRRCGGGSAGCWSKKRMNSALASGPRGSV